MKIAKGIIAFSILIILFQKCLAQPTLGDLAVQNPGLSSLPILLSELKTAKNDTGKIRLQVQIGSLYYWKTSIVKSYLDSTIFYGKQVTELSNLLKDTNGHNEGTFLVCKALLEKKDVVSAKKVLAQVWGEQHIRLLLLMAEYFINMKELNLEVLAQADPYLRQAILESEKIKSRHWLTESKVAQAKYYFRRGNFKAAKTNFYEIISYYQKIGDKLTEARWWYDLGVYIPDTDSTFADEVYSMNRAKVLYHALGKKKEESEVLDDLGSVYKFRKRYDISEKFKLSGIELLKATGIKKLWKRYLGLSEIYRLQGNLNKALLYALLSLKNIEELKDKDNLYRVYNTLGNVYNDLDDYRNSVKFYHLCLSNVPVKQNFTYQTLKLLLDGEIKLKNASNGLNFLQTFIHNAPPQDFYEKQLAAVSFGNCYNSLGDYKTAEKYYLEMIQLDVAIQSTKINLIRYISTIAGTEAYYTISKFYVERKQYQQAVRYLDKALTIEHVTPVFEREIKFLEFKLDSAGGNYYKSIGSYQRYIFLKDSIENIAKNKEFSTLKIQFETAQKENDNKLLRKEAMLQRRKMELSDQSKKFTYAGIIALFIGLCLVYNRYRLKLRKNIQLEDQQKEINAKNSSLSQLVDEKEWLLKEVHHRVKNNLQIIVSLLNTQSVYLKDETAVNAILESRHRVQAMSMLHQRIYQSDNMAGIAMSPYIHELVHYLKGSFNTGSRIIFNLNIDEIDLDLVQAVPVGLILNESITNALKYAFPNHAEGEVNILLLKTSDDKLRLRIVDSGIGLPEGFNLNENKSFGLKLIKGLSEDLRGTFAIESDQGTAITVEFGIPLRTDYLSRKKTIS